MTTLCSSLAPHSQEASPCPVSHPIPKDRACSFPLAWLMWPEPGTQVYLIKQNLCKSWPAHSLALWLKVLQHQIALLAEVQGSSALGASPEQGGLPWAEAPSSAEMEEAQKIHLALRSSLFKISCPFLGWCLGRFLPRLGSLKGPTAKRITLSLNYNSF